MGVEIKQVDGLKLSGKDDSGHEITIDTKTEYGGHDSGPTPMNLLLLALGGCTLMDVISICNKMKVDYDDITVQVDGERREEHPKVFKNIKIKYIIYGKNPDEAKIKKSIDLSIKKYCSAHAMLEKTASISSSFEIIRQK